MQAGVGTDSEAYRRGIKAFIAPPTLPKLDLTIDAEHAANLVNVSVVVNVHQSSLLNEYTISNREAMKWN